MECDICDVETAAEIAASLLEDVNGTNDEQTSKLMRYAVYHARETANNLARTYYDLHKKAQFKK